MPITASAAKVAFCMARTLSRSAAVTKRRRRLVGAVCLAGVRLRGRHRRCRGGRLVGTAQTALKAANRLTSPRPSSGSFFGPKQGWRKSQGRPEGGQVQIVPWVALAIRLRVTLPCGLSHRRAGGDPILVIVGDGGESYETWFAVHRFQEAGFETRVAAPTKNASISSCTTSSRDGTPTWNVPATP